jgi:hypothetical protein
VTSRDALAVSPPATASVVLPTVAAVINHELFTDVVIGTTTLTVEATASVTVVESVGPCCFVPLNP